MNTSVYPIRPAATDWLQRAACVGFDPELFFPTTTNSTLAAKAICAQCPVRAECLEHALVNGEKFGVWGGRSERERRRIRRTRGQVDRLRPAEAACGTSAGYYRHLRGTLTEPCGPCRAAHSAAQRHQQRRAWSTA